MPSHWCGVNTFDLLTEPGPDLNFPSGAHGRIGWAKDVGSQTCDLDRFVYNPGAVVSYEELFEQAENKVRADDDLVQAMWARREELFRLLSDAKPDASVAEVTRQGEDDKFVVDRELKGVVTDVLCTVKKHVNVENSSKMNALAKHNSVLQERVGMLTHHLSDRSKQLSSCRYAYFLEITHLRNQVYIKAREKESFEPCEAYFFDPTDFLEEELRQMLNEKIRISVKVLNDRLLETRRRLEDLEAQLSQQAVRGTAVRDEISLDLRQALMKLNAQSGKVDVVKELATISEKEMREWAEGLFRAEGWLPAPEVAPMQKEATESKEDILGMQGVAERSEETGRADAQAMLDELASLREKLTQLRLELERERQRAVDLQRVIDTVAVEKVTETVTVTDTTELQRERAQALAALSAMWKECRNDEVEPRKEPKEVLSYINWAHEELRATRSASKPATTLDEQKREAEAKTMRLQEELDRLKRQLAQLQKENAHYKKQLFEMMQKEPQEEDDIDLRHRGSIACGDGRFECAAQTNLTASWGGGFHMMEVPPSEAQLGIFTELDDLTSCAMGMWESTLEHIRASQRPPHGHGTGFCSRGAFLRLFLAAKENTSRIDELIVMAEALKRSELQQVIEGVRFLMESTLPDEDAELRDAIFGRGLNESALGSTTGADFAAVAKRIMMRMTSVIRILFQKTDNVELGVHRGRRIFVPGGAGGRGRLFGGAGGGLFARELREISPPAPYAFPGVLSDDAVDSSGAIDEAKHDDGVHRASADDHRRPCREGSGYNHSPGDHVSLHTMRLHTFEIDGNAGREEGLSIRCSGPGGFNACRRTHGVGDVRRQHMNKDPVESLARQPRPFRVDASATDATNYVFERLETPTWRSLGLEVPGAIKPDSNMCPNSGHKLVTLSERAPWNLRPQTEADANTGVCNGSSAGTGVPNTTPQNKATLPELLGRTSLAQIPLQRPPSAAEPQREPRPGSPLSSRDHPAQQPQEEHQGLSRSKSPFHNRGDTEVANSEGGGTNTQLDAKGASSKKRPTSSLGSMRIAYTTRVESTELCLHKRPTRVLVRSDPQGTADFQQHEDADEPEEEQCPTAVAGNLQRRDSLSRSLTSPGGISAFEFDVQVQQQSQEQKNLSWQPKSASQRRNQQPRPATAGSHGRRGSSGGVGLALSSLASDVALNAAPLVNAAAESSLMRVASAPRVRMRRPDSATATSLPGTAVASQPNGLKAVGGQGGRPLMQISALPKAAASREMRRRLDGGKLPS